ncbi:MAG TPA: protein-export chaperone SecB [Verrucomicrobiae bacterium]|jgi:preprotein translocase subunit SecB|nr:protein-export chaperone SecB [Verrucomicrobiae bacterium]
MTDTDTGAPEAPTPAATYRAPPIVILVQYLKDLSFENPHSPAILSHALEVRQGRVGVDLRITPVGPPNFEVVLKLRVEAAHEGKAAYLLDMEYAAMVQIGEVPEDKIEPLLMIEAPRLMFPYVRALVTQMTQEGGFAPLLVHPIDFHALYRDHKKKAAAAQGGGAQAQA